MFFNLEQSQQPTTPVVMQEISQQAINLFYKNEEGLGGATLNVPEGVTRIRPYLFDNMWPDGGFTVVLPDSVCEIQDYAFANADIPEVHMSKNVTTLPEHAFDDCTITKLYLHSTTSREGYPWNYEGRDIEIVVVD